MPRESETRSDNGIASGADIGDQLLFKTLTHKADSEESFSTE
jgi:hypothetical protein